MSETAGTAVQAETAPIEGAPPPAGLSYEWPPKRDLRHNRPPPPPELKKFVRAMSELGVPVHEIARRVRDRIGAKYYHMRNLYRDFSEDLIPRMKRGAKGQRRIRLVEKPAGWKPIKPGAPFSYADILAILQSDLDSRDLGRLYGVKDELVYKIRRGESQYTKYLLPRMTVADDDSPQGMAYRAMVTADLAVRLVRQMALMIERYHEKILAASKTKDQVTLYRKNAEAAGGIEERIVDGDVELRAARLAGWSQERPA